MNSRAILPLLLLLLLLCAAFSRNAAPVSDLTLPIFGRLTLPHVTWKSEILITNHRDAYQEVRVDFIGRDDLGAAEDVDRLLIAEHSSLFRTDFLNDEIFFGRDGVGAVRLVAIKENGEPDPEGQIDAMVFVIAERPNGGTSRQEIHAVPASEYLKEGVSLAGIRHDDRAYTNVGAVNLDPTQAQRFFIETGGDRPWIELVVPAFSMKQIRLPLGPIAERTLKIYPEWAVSLASPVIPKRWAAYASTVDPLTGDAWTAHRIPVEQEIETPE